MLLPSDNDNELIYLRKNIHNTIMDILRETIEIYMIPDLTNIVLEYFTHYLNEFLSLDDGYIEDVVINCMDDDNLIMIEELVNKYPRKIHIWNITSHFAEKGYEDTVLYLIKKGWSIYFMTLQSCAKGCNLSLFKKLYYIIEPPNYNTGCPDWEHIAGWGLLLKQCRESSINNNISKWIDETVKKEYSDNRWFMDWYL